jgi:hypothetical protein
MKEEIRTIKEKKKDVTLKEIIAEIRAFQEAMEVCLDSKEPASVEARVQVIASGSHFDRRCNENLRALKEQCED